MKKKQTPIVLGSIMAVAVIGVAITNIAPMFWAQIFSEKHQQAPAAQGEAKALTETDKSSAEASVVGATKKPRNNIASSADEDHRPDGIPEKPSIVIEKTQYMKPVQNDSAVSSGWYNANSNTTSKEAEIAHKRGN